MSDDHPQKPARTGVVIQFPAPFRSPKIFEKTSMWQAHGGLQAGSPKAGKARPGRRRLSQKILFDFPGVMARAFDDFCPAAIPVWRADIECADDEEFVLAEIFLSRFRKVTAFAHVSSYSLKALCEDWHSCLGVDGAYVPNGILIVAAIDLGFRGKCIAGTPNAIFNLSRADLKSIARFVAEYRANVCAVDLRGLHR